MRWLLFLYPWLELWSLIQLGIETSPGLALMWVLGALVMGSALMRWAGRSSLQRLAQASAGGTLPRAAPHGRCCRDTVGAVIGHPGLGVGPAGGAYPDHALEAASRKSLWRLPCCRLDVSCRRTWEDEEDIIEGEFSVTEATGHLEHLSDREPPDDQK